jgi:hypothetical protein
MLLWGKCVVTGMLLYVMLLWGYHHNDKLKGLMAGYFMDAFINGLMGL